MQTLKNILILPLVVLMLASWLPRFSPDDVNRNHEVDLQDAIILVQAFAKTSEAPAEFEGAVASVFSVLRSAAGLKTVLKQDKPRAAGQISVDATNNIYLSSILSIPANTACWHNVPADTDRFVSVDLLSETPPPEIPA